MHATAGAQTGDCPVTDWQRRLTQAELARGRVAATGTVTSWMRVIAGVDLKATLRYAF